MLFLFLTPTAEATASRDKMLEFALIQIAQGDTEALGTVYDLVHRSVYAYALTVLKNTHDAEDVLQDCFGSIWNGAGHYKSQNKPMAWIMTVTRNLCYMKLRSRNRASYLSLDDILNSIDEVQEASVEDKLIVSECLLSLDDREREIVVLHAVSGFKHREIASMLEMPLATVLSKYARAMKKMQKFLTQGDVQS